MVLLVGGWWYLRSVVSGLLVDSWRFSWSVVNGPCLLWSMVSAVNGRCGAKCGRWYVVGEIICMWFYTTPKITNSYHREEIASLMTNDRLNAHPR